MICLCHAVVKYSSMSSEMSDNTPGDIKIQAALGPSYLKKSTKCNAERKTETVVDESLYNVHVRAFYFNFVIITVTFPDLIVIDWDDNLSNFN